MLFISFISFLEIQEIFGTQDYTTDQYEGTTELPETTPYEEEPTTYSSVRNKRAGTFINFQAFFQATCSYFVPTPDQNNNDRLKLI